ncbi:MAG: 5'-nucleotidase, lipoprotein e(P4) family [Bacillota bacterium]|nr:5'-nucleotidase, lipoprotein e(P4) family [Bacillota bacterium]
MMKKLLVSLLISFLSFSIYNYHAAASPIVAPAEKLQDPNTMSVLWYQTSGEAKALYYQGYTIGRFRLDEILAQRPQNMKLRPAIVLDIDETILDNSPCLAFNVKTGKAFPANWNEWVDQAIAKPVPGAIEFLKYANSKGIEIYYISNRNENQKKATIRNLQQVGAPMADTKHVLLQKKGEKGKEVRRMKVARTNDIILLFGDNLGDFRGFDDLTPSQRVQAVEKRKKDFGKKLIVFPNPMYGDWEGSIYHYDLSKTAAEKAKLRKESLQIFQP